MVNIMSRALVLAAISDLSGRPQKQIGLDMLLQGDLGLSDDYLRQLQVRLSMPMVHLGWLQRATVGDVVRFCDEGH